MNKAYVEGFVKACEAKGIDPEALVKWAQGAPFDPRQSPTKLPWWNPGASIGRRIYNARTKPFPALPSAASVAAAPAPAPAPVAAAKPSGFEAGNQKAMMRELLQ